MADIADFRAPLYLQTDPVLNPPVAVECPVCYAVVLVARLDDHKQAAHGG